MINLWCKISSEEGHMIIFTVSLDLEPDPILLSDPYPAPLKQIISNPGGSGSGSTTLIALNFK
jgi:hypothetical protein